MLHVFYRYSDSRPNWYTIRPADFTKRKMLENFMSVFKNSKIHIIADNISHETHVWMMSLGLDVFVSRFLECPMSSEPLPKKEDQSDSAHDGYYSWMVMFNSIKDNVVVGDYIYLIEDDFYHLEGSEELIIEGLNFSDFVTLYDCPDKYMTVKGIQMNINEMVALGKRGLGHLSQEPIKGNDTTVYRTNSTYWRRIPSTTSSFAMKYQTMIDNFDVWKSGYCDCIIWPQLKDKTLVVCLPPMSTHVHIPWIAPNHKFYEALNL
jgi:hypothetical protein